MKKNEVYTELSIQIGVLESKVDKVLQLLLEQQKPYIVNNDFVGVGEGFDIEKFKHSLSTSQLFQTTGIVDDETFTTEFK
jgi:hypothetical protein